jgi:hypothetical protein
MIKSNAVLLCALCVWGCSAPGESGALNESELGVAESALGNKDFDVDFSSCAEFAGIGFVPFENARPLVPAHYELAMAGDDAIMVVRVARCASSIIDGKSKGVTTTSQIGISLAGQDTSAQINNYTLFYATDQPVLHARLKAAGLDADNTPNGLSFLVSGGTLAISSSSPHTPSFTIGGAVTSAFPPQSFIASWWADGNHGVFRARTVFPDISFSLGARTLTTPAGSELAELIGGTTYTFAALDSYNTFPSSHLEVRDTD